MLETVLRAKVYDTAFLYGGFGYFDNMNTFFGNNSYKAMDKGAERNTSPETIQSGSTEPTEMTKSAKQLREVTKKTGGMEKTTNCVFGFNRSSRIDSTSGLRGAGTVP